MSRAHDFDRSDERMARIAWSRLAEPSDLTAQLLVKAKGPVAALAQVMDGTQEGKNFPTWRARLADLDPVADLELVQRVDGRVLIPGDDQWPPLIDDLEVRAPYCLWVRGPLSPAALGHRSAAIVVGARAATPYGERVAGELADGCATRGITVVSGAAYGIDGSAHRGALAAGGPTVAVMPGGVERAYPRGHDELIDRIARVGVVVSEIPPGSMPTRWRFVQRNRLIAALARVTVMVEAGRRSGALITVDRARDLNRVVAAVPGPVFSAASRGCHDLLRLDNDAVCVTSADELAELAGEMGEHVAEQMPLPVAVHDGLPPDDLRVFDALPLMRPVGLDSLIRTAGLATPVVLAALGRLELRRLARRDSGGWRRDPSGARKERC